MKYFFHPKALSEHKESAAFYEKRRKGLGLAYVTQVESTAEDICEFPKRFKAMSGSEIRQAPVSRFPHTLFFREVAGEIQILSVAQNRRKPGYWQSRI